MALAAKPVEHFVPLSWQISGPWRFDGRWVALSEGPAFEDYREAQPIYADQVLRRLIRSAARAAGISLRPAS